MTQSTARVTSNNTVNLGNRLFNIVGKPQRRLVSVFPQKIVTGDYTNESNPVSSAQVWDDARGGIGVENWTQQAAGRPWYSTLSLRHNRHLVLQRRAISTASNDDIGSDTSVTFLAELNQEIYSLATSKIYLYDDAADSWGSSLRTFESRVTDVITAPIGGTDTLIVAQRDNPVDYTTNGSSWTDEAVDGGSQIELMTYGYKDLLWGISNTGELHFLSNFTDGWKHIATLKIPYGEPTKLFIGPGPSGEDLLYCSTQVGLFVYDNLNERFVQTELVLPYHEDNGRGVDIYRGAIYFSAGASLYRYQPGQESRIDIIGPDLEDGLPESRQGVIKAAIKTHNDFIVLLDGSELSGSVAEANVPNFTDGIHTSTVMPSGFGRSSVLGLAMPRAGWEVKWSSPTAGQSVSANMLVTTAYTSYRLWWAAGENVYYQQLPTALENPNQVTSAQREASGIFETPWYDAGAGHQDKTALSFKVDSVHPSSSETVLLQYAVNYDDADSAYRSVVTKSVTSEESYSLPTPSNPEGIVFRAIKAKLTLTRSSTRTSTPDVKQLALVFKKPNETLWGWDVVIDFRKGKQGQTPTEQRDYIFGRSVDSLVNKRELIPFTFRDELDNEQNFWVMITNVIAEEGTGRDVSGLWRVTVAEPRQS